MNPQRQLYAVLMMAFLLWTQMAIGQEDGRFHHRFYFDEEDEEMGYAANAQEAAKMFIDQYKWLAIKERERTGVPASIKMAQAIHETGYGRSRLAKKGNNFFGIKCHRWEGDTIKAFDDCMGTQCCFRKYPSITASFEDHSNFLKRNSRRYGKLFLLDVTDYKGWANGLREAGYATQKTYSEHLIRYIEKYKLYELDGLTSQGGGQTDMSSGTKAQPMEDQFIERYKTLAIREMKRTKIPASVQMAMAIMATKYGTRPVATEAKNFFNLVQSSDWTGGVYVHRHEDKPYSFRKYSSPSESFKDYANFMRANKTYKKILRTQQNYLTWACMLEKNQYANSPGFTEKMVEMIEKHQLYKLDGSSEFGFADERDAFPFAIPNN